MKSIVKKEYILEKNCQNCRKKIVSRFAEAPDTGYRRTRRKTIRNPLLNYLLSLSFISCAGAFSAPFFSDEFYSPKKGGREIVWFMVYFRFRNAQKLTTPMMQATATTANIATSVVMNGVSGVAVGSVGAGAVGSAASGSISCAALGDSPTVKYVEEDEPQYDAVPSNCAIIL